MGEATVAGEPDYEAIIIGAGVCGIYQLYRLVELGVSTTVLESGADLGGTWFWNRYPGARFDSESITYGYSFSEELLQEWDWKERFSGQPENLRYLNYVVDKFDLRKYMQFDCTVESAEFDDDATLWRLQLDDGRERDLPLLHHGDRAALGTDAAHYRGLDGFEGQSFHTYNWPRSRSSWPASGWPWSAPGPPACRSSARSPTRWATLTVFQRRPELVRTAAQRRDLARGDGRHQDPVRRDLRDLRPHTGRFPPRARPAALLRGLDGGAGGEVGEAVRRARASASGWPTSATSS